MKPLMRWPFALRVALIYALVALTWIIVSDWLLVRITGELPTLLGLSLSKGGLFVVVTALLLFWLLSGRFGAAREEPAPSASLDAWGLLGLGIGILGLLVVLNLGIIKIHGPRIEREAYANLEAVAVLKSAQLQHWMADRMADGQLLATDTAFARRVERSLADPAADPMLARELWDRLSALYEASGLGALLVLDPAGQTIAQWGEHDPPLQALAGPIETAHAEGRVVATGLYRDAADERHLDWIVPIAILEGESRRRVATIVLHVDPATFIDTFLERWPTDSASAETLLVERVGDEVVWLSRVRHRDWAPMRHRVSLDDRLVASVALRQDADSGRVSGRDDRGHEVLAAFQQVAGTHWRLIAKIDRDEVMAPLRWLLYWVSLIALFALLVLATAGYLAWRLQRRAHRLELIERTADRDRLIKKFYELPFVGMAITAPETKRWLQFNDRLCEILGYAREELLGTTWDAMTHPDDLAADLDAFERVLSGVADGYQLEKRFIRKDGRVVQTALDARALRRPDGHLDAIIATIDDISERKRQDERLRLAAALFESTREGVLVMDRDRRILQVNPAFTQLTGYTEDEAIGRTPDLLRPGPRDPILFDAMWESVRRAGDWQGELWSRRKNGEVFPVLLGLTAVSNPDGWTIRYVAAFSDLSRIKESESRLDFVIHHDPLTQLPNRLLLEARLAHALDVAAREGQGLALLLIDLDRFKDVNDSLGHPAGDDLLRQVAGRFVTCIGAADTIARLGGDEFAVLLEAIEGPRVAARTAERLIGILGDGFVLADGSEVRIGASIGISLVQGQSLDAGELLRQADAALYRAKEGGRNRFDFYTEDLTARVRQRVETERRLRAALAEGQLIAHYQPQFEIASGRLIGVEALVRWQDPRHGLVAPDAFIPLAEEIGLIGEIGDWILKEACRQERRWMDEGRAPLIVAVNLSAHQLHQGDIVERITRVLRESGYPPERLEIELTESALMEREGGLATGRLDRLRNLGVRLAVDDFGTGYSSLAYLRRFQLDLLKIDKRFIDEIDRQADARAIVRAIIAMGQALGLKILAEGVETQAQLEVLQALGCDSYQGYLKSPPLAPEALRGFLEDGEDTRIDLGRT